MIRKIYSPSDRNEAVRNVAILLGSLPGTAPNNILEEKAKRVSMRVLTAVSTTAGYN